MDVDDFEATYEKVGEMGVREKEGYFSHLYELPDGAVQMHIRDPVGSIVEVNWPDITTLDRSVLPEIKKLEDDLPQIGEAQRATLYLK